MSFRSSRVPANRRTVAIVGAGMMGRVHAKAALRNGAVVAAVSDPDRARATELSESLGGRAKVLSFEQLLEAGDAGILHVCTPADSHFEICEAALAHGFHVLCEKPVAGTAPAVERLVEIAKAQNVVFCPVHQFPFQRGVQKISGLQSALGTLIHIAAEICTAGATGMSDQHRHQVAIDILPHPLSVARAITGFALDHIRWHACRAAPGEILVSGVAGNTGLSFLVSTRSRPTANYVRVFGDRGTATIDLFHGYTFVEPGNVSRWRKASRPFTAAARAAGGAAINGINRGIHRETSFPGLAELVSRFYAAASGEGTSPILPAEIIEIARARDTIIALLD